MTRKDEQLHNDLLVDAIDYLGPECNGGKNRRKFTQKMKRYFTTPAQEAILTKDLSDVFSEMSRVELLGVGKYDILLEVTDNIDPRFTKLINETMEKIDEARGEDTKGNCSVRQTSNSHSNNCKYGIFYCKSHWY